jgi:hypothetical protein
MSCSISLVAVMPGPGACCIAGRAMMAPMCMIVEAENCAGDGHVYGGDHSTCLSAACPTNCPCDLDHDGDFDWDDYLMFLDRYFAGDGDFNGDGRTDQADLTEFGACSHTMGCRMRGMGPGID